MKAVGGGTRGSEPLKVAKEGEEDVVDGVVGGG